MKVKLVAQTFSRSVSEALQFLSDSNMKGFTQCSAPIEFIWQACKLLIGNVVYIILFFWCYIFCIMCLVLNVRYCLFCLFSVLATLFLSAVSVSLL